MHDPNENDPEAAALWKELVKIWEAQNMNDSSGSVLADIEALVEGWYRINGTPVKGGQEP